MVSSIELIQKGISNPTQIIPYLKRKTGLNPWGFRGPSIIAAESWYKYSQYSYPTTSIWDEDWDLLIVLDACRPEWMKSVKHNFKFINEINTIHSVGSHSQEWISNTFNEKYSSELEDTIYITGNHYADDLRDSELKKFETAHDYGSWAYDSASPPANVVTDLAVRTARNHPWERCIVHYMQPHKPFMIRTGDRDKISVKEWSLAYEPYHKYFKGDISKEELINGFISNLEYVLEEVEILLENIDASTAVLTSDHAQSLGENGLWDHTVGVKHPSMRRVPWVETTATDKNTLDPREYDAANYDEDTIKENLRDLGYR
jgi:hypothetical protein